MTIKEIIEVLQTMPPNAKMGMLWDGAVRSYVEGIYLSRSGDVVGSPKGQPAYYDEDRPKNAPYAYTEPYFEPIPE